MEQLLQTLVIGTVYGSLYGFIAIGMVLVYRTTGVLNVAHGGIGIFCAYIARELFFFRGWPYYVALLAAVLVGAVLGLLFERLIIRPLNGNTMLQTAATLATYVLLTGVTFLPQKWVDQPFQAFPSPLTSHRVTIPGANGQVVNGDQILLVIALVVFLAGLSVMLKRTRAGLAMRAVSDDAEAAGLMGIEPQRVRMGVWVFSFALSALTTLLVVPITLLESTTLSLLTLKALTVAFLGSLVSLPLTVTAALALGFLESYSDIYLFEYQELKPAWPFILMFGLLLIKFARGRKSVLDDQPSVAAA
jgi:branched-subunit amino acid ABC-type transport system permease component